VPPGDVLGVFATNAAGTKIDYYIRRELRYDVRLQAGGAATADLDITLDNGAPANAEPSYPLGPYPGTGLGVGDSMTFITTTCAPGCTMDGATRDGEPFGMEAHTLRGSPVLAGYLRADAGRSGSLQMTLRQPDAWSGDEGGGEYRLTLQGQATLQPTTVTVTIGVPAGMRIEDTNVPMEVSGTEAVWTGTLGREMELAVRFQRPFPSRLWS
jgi:hypothetical protein